ncbi:transposase, partial [Klebsiella pneumoniae]|uniref:transposase n=1 Tax=Klebsiella pneumoniae TaxID=573 RepID=UPI003CED370D
MLCHGTVCVVGKIRDLILQLSKSSIYSTITTVLVIKRVFRLTLRAAQGFIDSIFTLMNVPLRCPDYTSVSKRAKSVNVSFKT